MEMERKPHTGIRLDMAQDLIIDAVLLLVYYISSVKQWDLKGRRNTQHTACRRDHYGKVTRLDLLTCGRHSLLSTSPLTRTELVNTPRQIHLIKLLHSPSQKRRCKSSNRDTEPKIKALVILEQLEALSKT